MTPNPLELELGAEYLTSGFKVPEKPTNKQKGDIGEEDACKHIASLGYRIVKRNFRWGKMGEIDIVAYDDTTLVFIEVKTRTNYSHGTPESSVDKKKQRQLKQIAKGYYYVNGLTDAI